MLVYIFRNLPKIFLIVDYIAINFVFIFGKLYFIEFDHQNFSQEFKIQLILLNISWFLIAMITKPYKNLKIVESSLHFNALAKSILSLIAISFLCLILVFSSEINYRNIILYFIAVVFFMVSARLLLFLYRKKNRFKLARTFHSFNTVLVGENKLSATFFKNKYLRRSLGVRGIYSLENTESGVKYLGNINKLFKDIESTKISSIVFCDSKIEVELYKKIVEAAEHKLIRIYMVPDFQYADLGPHYYDVVCGIPFLKLIREPLANTNKQLLKRAFDIGFSFVIIIFILSWLIPIVALIIKIESNESVFFMQKRSGLNNEAFNCIKFRSMTTNKNADYQIAKKNDTRVTKFGAFMRKTSIDELPQFINVFFGEMSIVGPRPHMLSQTEMYSKITKKYMTRHIVKPGITGWAQVMGARGEIFSHRDMEKRIEKDIWYIQNWSFFLDMKIIFLTLYNIARGDEQAY